MKRIIVFFLLLLPLAATAQSSLYNRYASRADLSVAQVSGFRLNDSVRVDVVLLVADNSAAWNQLKAELDIRYDEGVTSWLAPLSEPAKRARWDGSPRLRCIANPTRRTVGFYRIDNKAQYDALLDYQLNNATRK